MEKRRVDIYGTLGPSCDDPDVLKEKYYSYNGNSYDKIKAWRKELDENRRDIINFQKENKLVGYFEVSCKDNINVKESFDFMVNYLI